MNLSDLLTETQKIKITDIIKQQCRGFKKVAELEEELFYKPYEKCRRQHTVTTAVISGFRPNTEIPGFKIKELSYGLYVQPELMSERLVLHIYSGDNPLGTQTVLERCREYNNGVNDTPEQLTYPIFAYIRFWTNTKRELTRISIVVPDMEGNEVKEFEIYRRPRVVAKSA